MPLLPSAVSIKVQSPRPGFTSVTTAPAFSEAISSGYSGSPWKLYWRTPLLRGETGCGREVYGGGGGALEPEQFEVSQRTTLCQHETFVYKIIDLLYFTSYMSYSFLLTICLRTEHAPIQLHRSSPLPLLLLCLDFPCPGSLISLL